MKAIAITKYGSPDVLELQNVEKPTPKDNQVLVNVHTAAANAADWHMIRGAPVIMRLDMGFPRPKHSIPGLDMAGVVEAVGKDVTRFQPGDGVFGEISRSGYGAFAEYVCANEADLVLKPDSMTYEQAAALPVSALTALQGLRHGEIKAGQRVLVNGASGGVGTFAVQIAKSFDTEVTGVCSTAKLAITRSLGADHVIDYTQEDFTQNGQPYDLIFCAVGNRSVMAYARALRPAGRCVVVGFTTMLHLFHVMLLGRLMSMGGDKKIGILGTAQPNQEDLEFLKGLVESGQVTPFIDRLYPLAEVPDAIRYVEAGRARGKVVINVKQADEI